MEQLVEAAVQPKFKGTILMTVDEDAQNFTVELIHETESDFKAPQHLVVKRYDSRQGLVEDLMQLGVPLTELPKGQYSRIAVLDAPLVIGRSKLLECGFLRAT